MLSEAITKEQINVPPALTGNVCLAGRQDAARAIAAVTLGFSTDPVARWMYPDAMDFLRWFPTFVNAFAGGSFEAGTAFMTRDGSGAALWLPPGSSPDEQALLSVIFDSLPAERHAEALALIEAMDTAHPKEPHWYLPMIAVETHMQGNGSGSLLMRAALDEVDGQRMPAYLESSNPRNVPLYQRFGFEVVGTIRAGSSPPLFPMIRPSA